MIKPMLHSSIEKNPRGQVRVYNADGKLLVGTSCAGYLAEIDEMLSGAKAEAWDAAVAAMVYTDGSPVELAHNHNPYRSGE